MTWNAEHRTLAQQVLTPLQYRVFELRHLHNFSLRQVALAEDLSVSTIRSTLEAVERKLRKAAA